MSFTSASRAISIHAPREGSDNHRCTQRFDRRISIHAPREGSDLNNLDEFKTRYKISIHAPREGSDARPVRRQLPHPGISIHAPREGSDEATLSDGPTAELFLSTLPARGATLHVRCRRCLCVDFYPRSPRGERPWQTWPACRKPNFYPRSPRGERHRLTICARLILVISIHAPREGSDLLEGQAMVAVQNFYPRSPRGERPQLVRRSCDFRRISIHAPREGSDGRKVIFNCYGYISIHAPREGSDQVQAAQIKDGK